MMIERQSGEVESYPEDFEMVNISEIREIIWQVVEGDKIPGRGVSLQLLEQSS